MFLKLAYLPSKLRFSGNISSFSITLEASLLEQIFVLRTSNFRWTETLDYCLNSVRPRKIPGVVVRDFFYKQAGL